MKRGTTLFLKTVVSLIGMAVLILCMFLLSQLFTKDLGAYRSIVIVMVIAAIPFFIGVFQTMKLLSYIDNNQTFSHFSIQALKLLKYCAISISALYAVSLPYIYAVADKDDAPGVMLLGLLFTFTPMIIAVFAAVFQKLLQNAIDLKSENDLTV